MRCENGSELISKIKDLIELEKHQLKDKQLTQNLKMLMRDFKNEGPTIIGEVSDFSRKNFMSLSQDFNLTAKSEALPNAKEVWRWVKALLQQYILLLK